MKIDFLKINYQRLTSYELKKLTPQNCGAYGYKQGTGVHANQYYYVGDNPDYKPTEDDYVAAFKNPVYTSYEHVLPPPTTFNPKFADVDRKGSGRNENSGEMYRDRLGYYTSVDITWDIVPNTKERQNLIKILKNLPSKIRLTYINSSGQSFSTDCYRGDIDEQLYLFIDATNNIWKGLSTTFTDWNVLPYSEMGGEPIL